MNNKVGPSIDMVRTRILSTLYRFAPKVAGQKGKVRPFIHTLRSILSSGMCNDPESTPIPCEKVKHIKKYLKRVSLIVIPAESKEANKGFYIA